MSKSIIRSILTAATLLLSTSLAFAAEVTIKPPDVRGAATSTLESTRAGASSTVSGAKAKARATAKSAKVDINSATQAQLSAVPGVGETYAAKIIAGRPYANKSQLKSRKVLPAPVYDSVKNLLIAKRPATKK